MSSTTSRSAGEATATPPVFSYAQAAKGRTTATTNSGATSNQATSGVSTPAKASNSAANTPSVGSERGEQSVNGSIDVSNKLEQPVEVSSEAKAATPTKSSSRPASPSPETPQNSTLPAAEKDDFILVGGPATESSRDRNSHAGATDKGGDAMEGKRGKKGKKQKNAEKEALEKEKAAAEEARLQEQLIPAPLPAVNFWLQRKEEAAKTKPTSVPSLNTQLSVEPASATETQKSPDTKRRGGKSTSIEDSDKVNGANYNSTIKDSPNSSKTQKKVNEPLVKPREDQAPKRAGPRGNRAIEKDDKSPSTQLPPPVEDATSWPTPETALEEEKRKAHEKPEKDEKDENTSNKPRPKEKWQTLPYVPSVAFNTPLPSRGGRGRGGGRGGARAEGGRSAHANSNGTTGDKTQNASINVTSGADADKRESRGEAPRAASLPPSQNKRPSSDPSNARDQRKPAALEKPRSTGAREGSSDIRITPYGDQMLESGADQNSSSGDARNVKQDQGAPHDAHTHGRSAAERRSEPNIRSGYEQSTRAEGRQDRGRGGFRGRGNHNYQNGQHPPHLFTNGHNPQHTNGYAGRQAPGPYSPPLQGGPYNQYPIPPSRGGRSGNSRSQSIPNSAVYPRFTNGGQGQHIPPPLQTSNMYDYTQSMQSMSAAPYNPYIDHASVLAMVKMQLEYYFSIDNLCKDVFLRKHMDSQGFVFLNFIASFKRIQALTQDFDLLYYACHESEIIEQIKGEDGVDRMRRKEGWEKWVLPVEERDESARNAGPSVYWRPPPHHMRGQMMMPGNHSMSPLPFSPNGTDFRPYGNGGSVTANVNGNGNAYHPETPLSAAVPEFAPGLLAGNGSGGQLETFTDEEVANLTLVFAPPKVADDSKPKVPYHTSASRTFSNGSIDGRSIAEEMTDDGRQGRALTNGSRASETSPESLRRSKSPFGALSPTNSAHSNSPPVMWVKGQRQQAPVSEHQSRESYLTFRARALKRREASDAGQTHSDMTLLYEFWSHFLCRNFNTTMYTEFRQYAFEDAQSHALSGMKNLISYYDEMLISKKKTIPDTLAGHYVDLVKAESSEDRPAFERLRAAWRNGALDLKSRKKIDSLIDQKLREDLEQAPKQKMELS